MPDYGLRSFSISEGSESSGTCYTTINDLDAIEDLHNAALVCHRSEIALNRLWRTVVSLAPLLNTLAPMQYSKEESNWTLTKDLDQAHWVRFHAYSRRICIVDIRTPWEQWSHPVSNASMKIVQESMPPWCHFPRPTRILILYETVRKDMAPLLRNSLYVVSTSMRELDVCEIKHISRNAARSLVHELFHRIGELDIPCLESLTFRHVSYSSDSPSFPPLIERHASTLSALNLFIPFSDELWIAAQDLHNLKRFSVNLGLACRSDMSNFRDTLTALDDLTSGPLRRLEKFTVTLLSSDIDTEQRRLEVFKCIGRMTQLRSLAIMPSTPIIPHAIVMWDMGRDLCQLQTLSIDIGRHPVGGDNIDNSAYLILILQIFPHLKRLAIRLTCNSAPDIKHTKAHSSLEVLDVGWSPAPRAK